MSCIECALEHRRGVKSERKQLRKSGRCACGAYRRMGRMSCHDCAALEFVKKCMRDALLVDMGICTKCLKNPARVREKMPDRLRPKRPCRQHPRPFVEPAKPKGPKAGTRLRSFERARFIDCDECAKRRVELRHKRKLSRVRDALVEEAKRAERAALDRD